MHSVSKLLLSFASNGTKIFFLEPENPGNMGKTPEMDH